MRRHALWVIGISFWLAPGCISPAADQPQWGQAWSRNLISAERGLPASFEVSSANHVKWSAQLGTETHGSAIIAGGRVYIGTNNGHPRNSAHQGDRGVLMCFEEQTGKFLWQLVVPKRIEDIYFDWPNSGICSPVTVEGERVYLVSNRGEVMCLDAHGMANGNDGPYRLEGAHMDPKLVWLASSNSPLPEPEQKQCESSVIQPGPGDADILWMFELTSGAGIWSHDGAHSSILIDGEFLYLNTGTGVDNTHKKIRTPDAPSLVVLDKRTGRLLARDREAIAPNIFHCTWSAPSLAEVNGKRLIFFAAGNGVIYGFEPLSVTSPELATLKKVFWFDFDPGAPKENVHRFNGNRRESPSNFFGMPVFHRDRLYVAGGGDIWWGKNQAWLKCIDVTRAGDLTTNGLVWSYPLEKHVMGTPAVADGLVFIADTGRMFHCVDAQTGERRWTHEIEGEAWASPYIADGKVYLGTRSGQFYVLSCSREKSVLGTVDLSSPVSATATAANGVLYVATMNKLYALAAGGPAVLPAPNSQ
jgi:outer membrane protein assembly factor BamB